MLTKGIGLNHGCNDTPHASAMNQSQLISTEYNT